MKKMLLAVFLTTATFLVAQSSKNVESRLFKVNAFLPGASFELGAGENTTFNFDLTLYPAFSGNIVEIFPAVGADFRYFTNIERRISKGKSITGNSGNYVAFVNQLVVTAPILGNLEYDGPLSYNTSIVYGLQRTYRKGFYWGLFFGPGFYTRDNDPTAAIFIDAKLGWVLSKRNN